MKQNLLVNLLAYYALALRNRVFIGKLKRNLKPTPIDEIYILI